MAETAQYPSAITTQLFNAVARKSTTLTSDITSSTTPLPVASSTGFPTEGFAVVENETIYYKGTTATSLGTTTCTRGYDGTAVAHVSGLAVKYAIVASNWNRLKVEIEAIQTYAGTSGGTQGGINAKYLGGSTENQLSPIYLGGSTESQLNLATTQTLTNKRIVKREYTEASNGTPTPNSQTTDIYTITALAVAAEFAAPIYTPNQGQTLLIRIKDDGTARALTWNAIYRAGTDIALPTTTVISKTMYVLFIYNSTDTKWDLVDYIDNI